MTAPADFTWNTITAAEYGDMFGMAPPAAQARSAFLYGEAIDSRGENGATRYLVYRVSDGVYCKGSRPITFAEWRSMSAAF